MKYTKLLLNVLLFFSVFYSSIFFSWTVLSSADFLYSPMYRMLDIKGMVQKYAPKNRIRDKKFFYSTTREDHERIFGEIVNGINNAGEGLDKIKFKAPQMKEPQIFLTDAELQHLIDVSDVVFWFKISSYLAMVLGLFSIIVMTNLKLKPARAIVSIPVTFGVIGASAAVVFIIGAKNVFYVLHQIVFKDHQWFFYYEESLMTTFMHAPDIFGYITLMLVALAINIYIMIIVVIELLFNFNRGIN